MQVGMGQSTIPRCLENSHMDPLLLYLFRTEGKLNNRNQLKPEANSRHLVFSAMVYMRLAIGDWRLACRRIAKIISFNGESHPLTVQLQH